MSPEEAEHDRPPWLAAETLDDPFTAYDAARRLGDEPDREWSFSLLVERLSVLDPSGLDRSYEPLGTWEEVTSALTLKGMLESGGFVGPLNYSLSVGFSVYDSSLRSTTGRLRPPGASEPFRGRHVVALAAYDDARDELVFLNSWGERWGDRGVGYMSQTYFDSFADEVILSRPTWVGPSPAMSSAVRELGWRRGTPGVDNGSIWVEAWMREPNRIKAKTVSLRGRQQQVRRRMLALRNYAWLGARR